MSNPVMWAVAGIAAATVWGWPGPLALLKPTVAPFALVGITRRGWWACAAGLAAVSLLFLPLWPEYANVLLNARNEMGPGYILGNIPIAAIPIIGWLLSDERRDDADERLERRSGLRRRWRRDPDVGATRRDVVLDRAELGG